MPVQQLAELVGKNLYQLSSLAGLTGEQYEEQVLPCVCQQIVQCGDTLAQQYLMEVRSAARLRCRIACRLLHISAVQIAGVPVQARPAGAAERAPVRLRALQV